MNIYSHSVYWIHLPDQTDYITQGYVGVSNDPARRLTEHLNTSKFRNDKNPYFGRILNKHSKDILQTILYQGTEDSCYSLEEELRPSKNIGWNANCGGYKPPSKKDWKPTQHTLDKRSDALKGIPRTESWRENLSNAKKGDKNGMYGKKIPCSHVRRISIIQSKHFTRLESLILVFSLLKKNIPLRKISKETGYGVSVIINIKKYPELYLEAFPILKKFETC